MGFESPQSIERKIQMLDDVFEALARSYPKDQAVLAETRRFRDWRDTVRGSLTSSFFPSTIAPEYEQWQHRYSVAFENAQKAAPTVKPIAPSPEAVFPRSEGTSPWIYAALAVSGAIALIAVAKLIK